MNKFIVALNEGSREQRNAITAMFQAKGWYVWHHMEDLWLLANVPDSVTAHKIWDDLSINPLISKHTMVVIKISANATMSFWGLAPKEGWPWMKEFWGNAD